MNSCKPAGPTAGISRLPDTSILPGNGRSGGNRFPRHRDTLPEQPIMDMARDGPQPLVADRLAVDAGHVRALMPHDVVGGGLVLRLVGHGAEGVSQGVESSGRPLMPSASQQLPISFVIGLSAVSLAQPRRTS